MNQSRITANLPSRDFDATEAFYAALGFERAYRGDGWMILHFDGLLVEFFPHPDLDPKTSWFSAGLRTPAIAPIRDRWAAAGCWSEETDIPRLTGITDPAGDVPGMFCMIDPDGSLWRIMEDGGPA